MTFGVYGTDLMIPVRQPNGKIAFVGGDSFEHGWLEGNWRSPILLRADQVERGRCVHFTSAAGGRTAKQILPYNHGEFGESTRLPTDVITIGNRMILHYMVMGNGLQDTRWTGMAYSDNNGEDWTLVGKGAHWHASDFGGLRQMTSMLEHNGYVYVMTARGLARNSNAILHRVHIEDIFDKSKYEWWGPDGSGQWRWGRDITPGELLERGTRLMEFCFRKIEGKFVLLYATDGPGSGVYTKVADTPEGNWVTARTVKHISNTLNWRGQNNATVAQLYGPYIMPGSTLRNMDIVLSQWNVGGGNNPYHAMLFGGIDCLSAGSPSAPPAPAIPDLGALIRNFLSRFRR